jgi:hypothetical protein
MPVPNLIRDSGICPSTAFLLEETPDQVRGDIAFGFGIFVDTTKRCHAGLDPASQLNIFCESPGSMAGVTLRFS